jgi:manganese/iron transport system substrate-binding protein
MRPPWSLWETTCRRFRQTRRLIQSDPSGTEAYQARALAFAQELEQLNTRIVDFTSRIPVGRRLIVTSHETMQYFSLRYGYQSVGSIFPGIGTEKEPSPLELGQLASAIRRLGVNVIFTETVVNDRLARSVASETGARIVRLYSDSLGAPQSGADTYVGMMNTNLDVVYGALR